MTTPNESGAFVRLVSELALDPARVRRSPPPREEPLRSPFAAMRAAARPVQPPAGKPDAEAREPGSDGGRAMVERAVEGAYRVFEEYLQWGQKAAAARSARAQNWRFPVGPKPLDMQAAAGQWLETWQELYRWWLGTIAPGGAPSMPGFPGMPFPFNGPGQVPFAPPSYPGTSPTPSELSIDAAQPVKLSLRMTQAPALGSAKATLHRAEGEGKLSFELDGQGARLVVPANQAPGSYSGVLQDAQGAACGMVIAQVSAASGNAR